MSDDSASMMRWRIGFGVVGVLAIGYGTFLLVHRWGLNRPVQVAKWAIGADIVTDGVLIPAAMVVGWVMTRFVAPRARRYLQGGLIGAASVTLIALPLIHRRNMAQPGQGLLLQNYQRNIVVLIGVIAAVTTALYVIAVIRDHVQGQVEPANERSNDQG